MGLSESSKRTSMPRGLDSDWLPGSGRHTIGDFGKDAKIWEQFVSLPSYGVVLSLRVPREAVEKDN